MQIRIGLLLGLALAGARGSDIPEPYRRLPLGEMKMPSTRAGWEQQRREILQTLNRLLGERPPRPSPLGVRARSREEREQYTIERIEMDNGVDSVIPAAVVVPKGLHRPAPAILLLHWHGGGKEGVLFAPEEQNMLPTLLWRGYVLMAIDGYFGDERLGQGPAGAAETTPAGQRDSFFKLHMWLGRTLWGMMLRDQQIALDYLSTRPEVDRNRIGVTGMSMGGAGAWWLAALDERVKAVVAVASFTRYRELINARGLSTFGVYYFVPGLLKHFDSEAVMGLIAPRPFLAQAGDRDPASPVEGARVLEAKLKQIYGLYQAQDRFRFLLYGNTGHRYPAEMKYHTGNWFDRWLH